MIETSGLINRRHGYASYRRGIATEYRLWQNMRTRCTNPKARDFKHYGGRGISVCPLWAKSFTAFLRDVGRRPSPAHTFDRIDNNGNYEPGNVRWATDTQQNNNRRNSRHLTFDGCTRTLPEWAEAYGINRKTLESRLKSGWPVGRALKTAVHRRVPHAVS